MRKLRIPFTASIDKVAKAKRARVAILKVAEKMIDKAKNPDALARMRTDICQSIVQGVQKETTGGIKPSVEEALSGLLKEERLMRICSKLGISENEVRELVKEGLQ